MQKTPGEKSPLHPRSRHKNRYELEALCQTYPGLKKHIIENKLGETSIDFTSPEAVMALNKSLLMHFYGIKEWDIPAGYLCPPVPGRADYMHYAADLLARSNRDTIPTGPSLKVLDIGVGANCIYPIIGRHEYGWSFVGSDADKKAVESAKKIVSSNALLSEHAEIRFQPASSKIFQGIIAAEDEFDLVICNPPFHSSMEEAQELTDKKWQNLGVKKEKTANRNFGGKENELVYPGGETAFISNMIRQSVPFAGKCYWFTALVSRSENLPEIQKVLKRFKPTQSQVIEMSQGQKSSRLLAWSLMEPAKQMIWKERRFW